ncbi:VPLPA-CTERM sorting domain-containing protein [Cereibacter sp. SYSU M97828]|nr:VPLPA-CTERM sorting domain-containing protein [Cereibacter flavus]
MKTYAALLAGGAVLTGANMAAAATVPSGAIGYALGNNGFTLVTMPDLNAPGGATGAAIRTEAGQNLSLSSLAFRPSNRQMYGYSDIDDTVYAVDVATGVASKVVTAGMAERTTVDTLGFDFNNVLDAARIVTTADENRVFFPNNTPPNIAGEAAGIVDLFYGAGDVNEGRDPSVFANAYTNAVPNPTANIQFVLDSQTDSLATLGNNTGLLTTIGSIFVDGKALDFTSTGGFDILSLAEGNNQALALLSTGFSTGIYEIDLTADAEGRVNAYFLGAATADFGALDGFAVVPPAPVPLPAGIVLLGTGLLAFAGIARRRRA